MINSLMQAPKTYRKLWSQPNNTMMINTVSKRMVLRRQLASRVKNQIRKGNQLGQRPRNSRKKIRNKKQMICQSLPTNWITISSWKIRRSSQPSKSLRTVLMISRKTRIGRSRWPRSGTNKIHRLKMFNLDHREILKGKVSTHTVSQQSFSLFITLYLTF